MQYGKWFMRAAWIFQGEDQPGPGFPGRKRVFAGRRLLPGPQASSHLPAAAQPALARLEQASRFFVEQILGDIPQGDLDTTRRVIQNIHRNIHQLRQTLDLPSPHI